MKKSLLMRVTSFLGSNSRGLGLVEVIVALAILGLISAAFLNGLSTSLNAVVISDEGSTAIALAQGQMEYVKSQEYDDISDPLQYSENTSLTPADYTVEISASRLDPEDDGFANDDGLQQITIIIRRQGNEVFTLVDYLVKL